MLDLHPLFSSYALPSLYRPYSISMIKVHHPPLQPGMRATIHASNFSMFEVHRSITPNFSDLLVYAQYPFDTTCTLIVDDVLERPTSCGNL